MLISLQIENFALIDRLELDFSAGLNVLTGETGAGKSIILDALDAALGGKVGSRSIRTGADRASIEATFKLAPDLRLWLESEEIDLLDEEAIVCSRELTAGKSVRSRSRVNGVLVNKQQMDALYEKLVEITAQGQTVQLGQPGLQRSWLDGFGGADLIAQREKVATAFASAQQALQALEKRRQFEQQRLQQLDLFEYQAKELSEADLSDPDELTNLEQERQRLSHSVELQQQSYEVFQALYQNDSGKAASDLLGQAENVLTDMLRFDEQVQPILDMVSSALADIQEASREISAYGDGLETDPERLQEVEARIVQLKQIIRKYGPTLADAIAFNEKVQRELAELSGTGQSIEVLEEQYDKRQAELVAQCAKLTKLRREAARSLEALLIRELKPLAMEKVQFEVQIDPIAPAAHGADRITFVFSPNPGEPLQPLNAIASGGEMSRFLLALKACLSQVDAIGTMVFDEIDVGVSGRVAQAIAEKLYQLSLSHQVLCVTHQPIVAAMADSHFHVDKQVIDQPRNGSQANGSKADDVRTVVRVRQLDESDRREELAQIAGGRSAQEAIAFAESLLTQAANARLTTAPAANTVGQSASQSAPPAATKKTKARSKK
ncbi:DNA repair protein RecN [Microcoleus sp. FACHB-1515]|uniref:DNA repair protein RecN n=1 Tax=Cyanophyceae TaxID=3028117 RepID=UPI0016861080|nr:DNA repair protein RecN [Microcoleus sp. FACHB-1515]MBD2089786.1 DNA repair protein RecN [Microcoleus sp. FACHB-1515]